MGSRRKHSVPGAHAQAEHESRGPGPRQLGEQYAQLERSRHLATGEERSKRTVHNIDEDDVDRWACLLVGNKVVSTPRVLTISIAVAS